jgi:gliding motility-associated-like protein
MSYTKHLFLFFMCICANVNSQTININSIRTTRQTGGDQGYTLDGLHMLTSSRSKLLNQNSFGSSGIYPKSVSIHDAFSTSGSLSQIGIIPTDQIFFFGSFNLLNGTLQQFTIAEIDSLYNWSHRGGKLIIGTQPSVGAVGYDSRVLNSKWGFELTLTTANYFNPTTQGSNSDIFNGPFGIVSSAVQGAGSQGFFNLMPQNSIVLATGIDGSPTLIMDCNTLDLITADVDGYTLAGAVTVGNNINNVQDVFWANTIVFMDKLQPPPVITDSSNVLILNSVYNSYQWYLNDNAISSATNQRYTPTEKGNYTVEVTVNGGCNVKSESFDNDSLKEILTLPNIFTPNNDNLNDIFNPIEIKGMTINQISIFNRWGNLIHEESFPKILWDGKSGNENASEGVYYWIIECQNKKGEKKGKHGCIQLIK